jgi:hypothetical protein
VIARLDHIAALWDCCRRVPYVYIEFDTLLYL